MDIRKILIVLLTVVAPAMLRAVTPEEVENVHLRDSRRYVSDMAGVLSPQALSQADSILGDIRRQTSAEVVMVIVDDLSGEDIDGVVLSLGCREKRPRQRGASCNIDG